MSDHESKSKLINLEQNGRVFPLWVMENFKKYILPEIIRQEGEDPCNEKRQEGLTLYQQFIGQYVNYQSPFKDILIYHGVGAGKTNSAINVYNILFNYTPKWNIFLLIPASLHDDPWLKDLKVWMNKNNFEQRLANIIFIHYDSPIADSDFLEKVRKADSSKTSIFIIDEAHKFINNVYNNITSKKGKRAQVIYDYIQQEKKENSNTRIMLLSATPVINNPFEYALIFNLLRPGSFPTSEAIFEQIFISSSNFASLNENAKNMFQRRILGLVSYYIGSTPDKFAQKIVHYVNIEMEPYFEEVYNFFEHIEEEKEKISRRMSRGKVNKDEMSTYSSYTRQGSNFVFPIISDQINGEKRPRPSQFRIKESIEKELEFTKTVKNTIMSVSSKQLKEQLEKYLVKIKEFINAITIYFLEAMKEDKEKKHTLTDDVETFHKKYNGSFTEFYESEKNKSSLFTKLYTCSPKFMRIIFNILKCPGTILIYSNYVEMEGLQILKLYMNFFGFVSFDSDITSKDLSPDTKLPKDGWRYCEFHGSIEKDVRRINKEIFNSRDNRYGKHIKIIMISPAGAEGINLNNVRQVHITEPYWNEVRIEQVIGRAVRFCQHKDLPMEERKVDVFRYKMIRKSGKMTTDERLEEISRKKNNLLLSFSEAVKTAAVDCELFKSHNMMGSKYKCFQFNEESLFEDPLGPAYQNKIEYDQKIDNGTSAKESNILKIKVRKITAVKKIDESSYSKEGSYWLYDETGVVYDYELNYPVGKVDKDESNNLIMIDNTTYVITNLINIPEFKIYN
jgi:superfamily II DNA or RNA helicase